LREPPVGVRRERRPDVAARRLPEDHPERRPDSTPLGVRPGTILSSNLIDAIEVRALAMGTI